MKKYCIVPQPKKAVFETGILSVPLVGSSTDELKKQVQFTKQADLHPEGYQLQVTEQVVTVLHSSSAGAFYALQTLRQLALQTGGALPCCNIQDEPGLKIRGAFLDISRGKVASLATLKMMADVLASFKVNHLQLYVEGFSFAYPSFKKHWQADKTPLTEEEIRELDAYCKERFIDFVPTQNSLGHMGEWLAKEEFRPLAEASKGLEIMGMHLPPSTLDPSNPGSIALVQTMMDDLLPNFDSGYFNVCLDEPFELGRGNNAARVQQEGTGGIYLEYLQKLNALVKARGKTMMMWGDVIGHNPEIVDKLPKDVVVLEWGYEAEHPMQQRAAVLQKAEVPFCLCPGTNSWSSFTGITDNMLQCTQNAANAAYKYGALGLITTDWGDGGHYQYLPFSWPGLVYSAALGWNNVQLEEATLARALDSFVFFDAAGVMGEFCLAAGRYYHEEEFPLACRTMAMQPMMAGVQTEEEQIAWSEQMVKILRLFCPPEVCEAYEAYSKKRKPFNIKGMLGYLSGLEEMLKRAKPSAEDAAITLGEMKNALNMVLIAQRTRAFGRGEDAAKDLPERITTLIQEHNRLWGMRNKSAGANESMAAFERMRQQIIEQL